LPRFSSTTEWPSPHAVAWCAIVPCSTTVVADLDFPRRPGHLAQPQGLEPRCSPLYRYDVADISIPVAPLGFSDTGSPMSWHYAFESNVNIGPKPGRTLQPLHSGAARKQLSNFVRSHVLQAPPHVPQPKLLPLFRSLASGLRSPVSFPQHQDWFPLTRSRWPRSRVSTRHATLRIGQRQVVYLPRTKKVPNPLGPCFCFLCAPPTSPRSPERSLSSFELANKDGSTRRLVSREPKLPRSTWPKPESLQTPNHRARRT